LITNDVLDYCFYHMMKCGGTTVRQSLLIDKDSKDSRGHFYKHLDLDQVPIDTTQYSNIFTVVRNPWERMASLYWDIQTRFVELYRNESDERLKRWYKEMFHVRSNFSDWLINTNYIHPFEYDFPNPNGLPLAAQRKSMSHTLGSRIDDVTVFRLEDGLYDLDQYLSKIYRGDWPVSHKHMNKSNKPDTWKEDYTQEAIDHVAKFFAEDIKRWNYDF